MFLKCVIIDDEPLARECISNYIHTIEFLELKGEGSNPIELKGLLEKFEVDLIFLDIQMPIMNGIDFLKITQNPPLIIITTAYPNYALDGFKLNVLDYLLKPITFDRFFQAACKAKDYKDLVDRSTNIDNKNEYFFIKCENKYDKVYFNDITYIQAMQNYVIINTIKGKHITLLPLKKVEQNLDSRNFIKVHKSYIVSISKIDTIENHKLTIQSIDIPISRNYQGEILNKVVNKKLWKKS